MRNRICISSAKRHFLEVRTSRNSNCLKGLRVGFGLEGRIIKYFNESPHKDKSTNLLVLFPSLCDYFLCLLLIFG